MIQDTKLDKILDIVLSIQTAVVDLQMRVSRLEQRMGNLEQRMDKLEQRMDNSDSRIDSLEQTMKSGFASLRKEIHKVEATVDIIQSVMVEQNHLIEKRFNRIEKHLHFVD